MGNQQVLSEKSPQDEDSLWFGPSAATIEEMQPDLMVYFVPGNPCMMSYYELFLSHLSTLLNSSNNRGKGGQTALVGGSTLPGFQLSKPSIIKGKLPARLEDEILNTEELVARAVVQCGSKDVGGTPNRGPKIILVAHSVGAYMVLEMLRRKAQRHNKLADLDIVGAVLLFPTVTEIAQSWHGSILSVRALTKID